MDNQITKVKNTGRVAAGKRLAEWNRKNKEDLLKNKAQVNSSGAQVNSSGDQVDTSESSLQDWLGVALILVGGGIAAYIYNRQNVQAPVEIKKIHPKIYME